MFHYLRMMMKFCTVILAGAWVSHTYASGNAILLVKSSDKPVYNRLVDRFSSGLSPALSGKYSLTITTRDKLDDILDEHAESGNPDLIITVGTAATQKLLASNPPANVLSALVPKSTYTQLLSKHGIAEKGKGKFAAIYIDQPIERQLRYIKKLLPDRKNMGLLLGPSSRTELSKLKFYARKYGYRLNTSILDQGSYLPTPARTLFKSSQLMLAQPDSYVFNPQHTKWLLFSSYKYKVPFIAYSESFVKAGALAAMHSTPEHIGQQLAEIVNEYLNNSGRQLKGSVYPKYYKISINPSIARSLRIPVPDLSNHENDTGMEKK